METARSSRKALTQAIPFAALSATSGVGSLNRLLWKGYLYDADLGCYCLGKRHYDPFALRFLEPDGIPYLDPSVPGGANPYLYCLNDPTLHHDATGTAPEWVYWLVGGVVLAGVIILTIATGGSTAPMLISAGIGAVSGIVFGGTEFKDGAWAWNSEGAAKGFCWGAVAGAIGGVLDMGVSSFAAATGLSKMATAGFRFLSNGIVATGLGSLQAWIEGEELSLVRAGITFVFGGAGSLFGKGWISSSLFGFGFSAAEGAVGEVLDYYSLVTLPWWLRGQRFL